MAIDPGYYTDHVWQMALSAANADTSVTFREVRLPRPMRVDYPRDPQRLADEWTHASQILLAVAEHEPVAYLVLESGQAPSTGWITDLVVAADQRRKGIATRLLGAARRWAQEAGLNRLTLEMQSKNYPAIALARKLGFFYSGYHDKYYPDEEIALFFTLKLK
jgi:GNAT superfamily N-acetyltransferase